MPRPFKKVLGVLSHHRETWHANRVSGGQYRKTLVFLMDENPCELRRRKVQVPRPTFKKSEGFEPKISKLGILTQLEAGSCAKLVFFRFVAVKPLVRLLAVSFHCPFACGYSPLQSACG